MRQWGCNAGGRRNWDLHREQGHIGAGTSIGSGTRHSGIVETEARTAATIATATIGNPDAASTDWAGRIGPDKDGRRYPEVLDDWEHGVRPDAIAAAASLAEPI